MSAHVFCTFKAVLAFILASWGQREHDTDRHRATLAFIWSHVFDTRWIRPLILRCLYVLFRSPPTPEGTIWLSTAGKSFKCCKTTGCKSNINFSTKVQPCGVSFNTDGVIFLLLLDRPISKWVKQLKLFNVRVYWIILGRENNFKLSNTQFSLASLCRCSTIMSLHILCNVIRINSNI